MARIRTNVLKWGNKKDGPNTYKHGRRGALDDAFWDEEESVDFPKSGKYKKKKKIGCPDNYGKSHVYIWIIETKYYGKFHNIYGWVEDKNRPFTVKRKICCGCGKIKKNIYNW